MRRYGKTFSEKHSRSRQRRREMKALRRSISDLGQAWAGLGISMGTNALRGVVNGMRATADALPGQSDANSHEDKRERPRSIRDLSNVASTWAEAGLAMGKVALEKSAEGLEITASTLENSLVKRQEPTSETTSDKPSETEESKPR